MQGQRQRPRGGRQRRNKPRTESRATADPVLIAARRPNSPLIASASSHRVVAASARPSQKPAPQARGLAELEQSGRRQHPPAERRRARIVQPNGGDADATEKQRLRLLDRLLLRKCEACFPIFVGGSRDSTATFAEEQSVE